MAAIAGRTVYRCRLSGVAGPVKRREVDLEVARDPEFGVGHGLDGCGGDLDVLAVGLAEPEALEDRVGGARVGVE